MWLGALAGAALTAFALFAGAYLPSIDWSNHLGLIAVLAHGGSSGALDYLERSLAPSPYLLFYAMSALFAQVMSVPAAAKLSLVLSAFALVPSAASLAEATGRSPRLALIAPLTVFGISMGYGFGSFVFATPLLFAMLATFERALYAQTEARPRRLLFFALAAALTYLGHGFLFAVGVLLTAARGVARGAALRRDGVRAMLRPFVILALGLIPAIVVALPPTLAQVSRPEIEQGAAPARIFSFEPLAQHLAQLGGHLLERGSARHWSVMYAAVVLLFAWLAWSLFASTPRVTPELPRDPHDPGPHHPDPHHPDPHHPGPHHPGPHHPGAHDPSESRAIELYASLLVLAFLFGPSSIEWPSSIWYVYPRFGVIAGLAVFLLPRADLRGPLGLPLALAALLVVGVNAWLNAGHVERFSAWAQAYDPVRAAVPPRSRVLALTVVPPGDLTNVHPALGSLYFYHLADGAAYSAFLFDKPSLPVHSRAGVRLPRAPFWRSPASFDPTTHGRDFDYLVLRGPELVRRTTAAGLHERVGDFNGWIVFRTREPTPRPSGAAATSTTSAEAN
ncbi:MAG: hypothetical protein IT384_22605 [Deltaproteobacteria bacterium]|nr:hypothetical protein [Deltaproteobacteria bacterium]